MAAFHSFERYMFRRLLCLLFVFGIFASELIAQDGQISLLTGSRRALLAMEERVLPPVVTAGPAAHDSLPDYYWAANPALKRRLDIVKQAYERSQQDPEYRFHAVTLITGSAGIGKTFIKKEVIPAVCPPEASTKLDLRELFQEWEKEGKVHQRPDLTANGITLSTLPSLDNRETLAMKDYLNQTAAAFYVIDSLDEVHPNDYTDVLQQVERFALDSERRFCHVVVLGRTFAFAEYWTMLRHDNRTGEELQIFQLNEPRFRTTGDVLVSSLNYDTYFHKLRMVDGEEFTSLTPTQYERFQASGFAKTGEFSSVEFETNPGMTTAGRKQFLDWVQTKPYVVATLGNLAGNGIIRDISEQRLGLPDNDRSVKEAYLNARLLRESNTSGRPGGVSSDHLELYLRLLEEVAVKVVKEKKVDEDGWFDVSEDDVIDCFIDGHNVHVRVSRILDRSGMKELRVADNGARHYRFEPVWLHRLFVERYEELHQQAAAQ
jgi:hypothetical protein